MAIRLAMPRPISRHKRPKAKSVFINGWGTSWGVFSHPADYTPVCTTELGAVAKLKEEFAKRNVKVLAVSVDALPSHHGWIKDINETAGLHDELSDHRGSGAKSFAGV